MEGRDEAGRNRPDRADADAFARRGQFRRGPRLTMAENGWEWLFVYGTLRRGMANPHQAFLERHGRYQGPASFQGRLFLVADYPGAVPSLDANHQVRGDLYGLPDPLRILTRLDAYEGCATEAPGTGLFRRERWLIRRAAGGTCMAWVYVYRRPTSGLTPIPSGDFVAFWRATSRSTSRSDVETSRIQRGASLPRSRSAISGSDMRPHPG